MLGAAIGTSTIRLLVSIPLFVMPVENAFAFPYVRTVLIQNGYPGVLMANTYRRPRTRVMGSFATPSIKFAEEENKLKTLKVCSIGIAVVVVVVAVEVVVVLERVDAVVDTWARVLTHYPTDATVASTAADEHGEKISPLDPHACQHVHCET